MQNPNFPKATPQGRERVPQNPREHYQRMLAMADERFESLHGNPFGNDPLIVAGWQDQKDGSYRRAAAYIAGLVGDVPTIKLREAVAPESLKDVLKRAGAGFKVMMMAGESREGLDEMIRQRRQEMVRMDSRIESFSDNNIQSILGRLWKKTQEAEAKLLPFEEKNIWSKLEAGYYDSLETAFLEALTSLTEAYRNYERMKKKI